MMAINFPDSPTNGQTHLGYVYDGEKWLSLSSSTIGAVRYDAVQGLTANQRSQARSNIDVVKKNYILNGAMMVSQENGSNVGTAGGAAFFPVDQFTYAASVAGFSLQQATMTTPGGSPNRMRIAVTTVDASVGAGDLVVLTTALEGLRVADLLSGTALAKTVTLQFGIRTLAGTYCVSFRNDGSSRSYVTSFTISAGEASTDVIKTVTLPLDVTGTWKVDNTAGINIAWCLMAGTTYQTGTPNAWTANANAYATSAQTNWMGNPIATLFELFDVSLTEGSVAPPFVVPDYASELAACKRYWQKFTASADYVCVTGTGPSISTAPITFSASMRATPTLALLPDIQANCASVTFYATTNAGTNFQITPTTPIRTYWYGSVNANARL